MVRSVQLVAAITLAVTAGATAFAVEETAPTSRPMESVRMNSKLEAYLEARRGEFPKIDAERRSQLDEVAAHVRARTAEGKPVQLVFVCTHNSRRSHMAQLWCAAAAEKYGMPIRTFSGGTEATAFNPRAVAAMERAGFVVSRSSDGANPVYRVGFAENRGPLECFSKKFDAVPNPKADFAAVMVCSEADRACPAVPGASARFAIPYEDPKVSDGKPAESATYDERCAQIAREMLYLVERAAK